MTEEKEITIRKKLLSGVKRVVIKIGTGVLTKDNNLLDDVRIKQLVVQIAKLLEKREPEIILVSSGAIGAGMGILKMTSRPKLLPLLQAAAAVGQSQLMKGYEASFRQKGFLIAQILLTADDLTNRRRYLNARNTLATLLKYRVVPIINENDSVSVDEIKFGDNDRLASLVTTLMDADLLVTLSDIDGLYLAKDQPQKIVSLVEKITPQVEKAVINSAASLGVGGMRTKLQAARTAITSGIPMIIANGKKKDILLKIFNGDKVGTMFLPVKGKMSARRRWIAYSATPRGEIRVDQGAAAALVERGKSLLASGITDIEGNFKTGDIVKIMNSQGCEFARGITTYSSEELSEIKGCKTSQIAGKLGYKFYDEVIQRDNLVIL